MTREERENALHCLKVMIDEEVCEECNLYGTTGTDHCEADYVRVAIKALEQEPTTKNDLGVDAVSRQAVLDLINADWKYENLEIEINNLPSVTPQEQKTGHWTYICNSSVNGLKIVECSECGTRTYGSGSFCPYCGARMVEPQESEG